MGGPVLRCPRCRTPLREDARFCAKCGRDVEVVRVRAEGARMWGEMRGVLGLYVLMLGVSCAAAAASLWGGGDSPAYDLAAEVFLAGVILSFALHDRRRLRPLITSPGVSGRMLLLWPSVFLGVGLVVTGYFYLVGLAGLETVSYLDGYRAHGWPVWSAFLMIAVYPALFEELAFRGCIQGRLGEILRPGEVLVLQAAMFAILHVSPLVFPSHFLLGLTLGWLRVRSGSLWPGIVFHGAWNALVLVEELCLA